MILPQIRDLYDCNTLQSMYMYMSRTYKTYFEKYPYSAILSIVISQSNNFIVGHCNKHENSLHYAEHILRTFGCFFQESMKLSFLDSDPNACTNTPISRLLSLAYLGGP